MRTIDVFGVMPVRLGQADPPSYHSQNDIPKVGSGVWIYRDRHGKRYVLARQGSFDAAGNFSGCEQGIRYEDWVKGGRLNLCTGKPWSSAPVASPVPVRLTTPPPAAPSGGVHPAVIAGGVGAAGFVALVATGVIKL